MSVKTNSDENVSSPSPKNSCTSSESTSSKPHVCRALRTGRDSPTPSHQGCVRTSLRKLSQEKRARKIRFYRNGDRFFTGLIYALSLERIRSWDALLEDLTRILVNQVNLPMGVRYIFTIDGKDKILSLDQFTEGSSYVCSSTDHFIKLDYTKSIRPQWCLTRKLVDSLTTSKSDWAMLWQNIIRESRSFIRPKIITVIKNGSKPRKAIRMVLNRKTAFSYEQVLNDITNQIKLDSGAVRKLFTLSGHPVTCLADFFQDEDIFIAYGPEKLSNDDFVLDTEECKLLTPSTWGRHHGGSMKKSRRGTSPNNARRRSSPALHLHEDSSYHSSRSSLSASPKLTRKVRAKSPSKNNYHQNGFHNFASFFAPRQIYEKYDIGRVIGDGNFATVHRCKERKTLHEFALKIIDKNKCRGKEHIIANEVAILRRVRHPHIVQLIEEYDIGNELFLVMELIEGGDLFDAIASASKFSEPLASGMVRDLASAIFYLHSLGIVHRDIKPENLLVVEHDDGTKSLKLGDFGLAVEVVDKLYTVCGTPTYVAPEILAETGYGLKVDIWAAGVITYILLCGFPPFVNANNSQEELFTQILAGNYEFPSPYWDDTSNTAKEFIVGMLQVEPEMRLSAEQMVNHPWLARDCNPTETTQLESKSSSLTFITQPEKKSLSKESWILTPSTSSDDSAMAPSSPPGGRVHS